MTSITEIFSLLESLPNKYSCSPTTSSGGSSLNSSGCISLNSSNKLSTIIIDKEDIESENFNKVQKIITKKNEIEKEIEKSKNMYSSWKNDNNMIQYYKSLINEHQTLIKELEIYNC